VASLPVAQDRKSLIRHLERTSPETLALAREWEDVAHDLYRVQIAMKQYVKSPDPLLLALPHLFDLEPLLRTPNTLALG